MTKKESAKGPEGGQSFSFHPKPCVPVPSPVFPFASSLFTCLHDFNTQCPWLKISGGQEAESTAQLNSRIWALQSLAFEKELRLDPNTLRGGRGELGEAQLLLP